MSTVILLFYITCMVVNQLCEQFGFEAYVFLLSSLMGGIDFDNFNGKDKV